MVSEHGAIDLRNHLAGPEGLDLFSLQDAPGQLFCPVWMDGLRDCGEFLYVTNLKLVTV